MSILPPNQHVCMSCNETFHSFDQFGFYCYSCIEKEQQAEKDKNDKLHKIYEYLAKGVINGRSEFFIQFKDDRKFTINPSGGNGETFDGELPE